MLEAWWGRYDIANIVISSHLACDYWQGFLIIIFIKCDQPIDQLVNREYGCSDGLYNKLFLVKL